MKYGKATGPEMTAIERAVSYAQFPKEGATEGSPEVGQEVVGAAWPRIFLWFPWKEPGRPGQAGEGGEGGAAGLNSSDGFARGAGAISDRPVLEGQGGASRCRE